MATKLTTVLGLDIVEPKSKGPDCTVPLFACNHSPTKSLSTLLPAFIAAFFTMSVSAHAGTEALLLIEADSGKVLKAENATYPWYPASITKLMTTYVTLHAVKDGRVSLDTLITVSPLASSQPPTKMGFKPGTQVTIDNALKMLLVHSANDMAVTLAEGVGGTYDKFIDEMNSDAVKLGMTQTHFVNPNGLPAEGHVSSARDLAMLARGLIREFPQYDYFWHIGAIKFGRKTMRNYNALIGRYPDADGMKTGFICASGFNLVASATRGGKRLIAVVLGAPSSAVRTVHAAQMLENGFNRGPLTWLTPTLGTVDSLAPIAAAPPDLHDEVCGRHRKRPGAEDADDDATVAGSDDPHSPYAILMANLKHTKGKTQNLMMDLPISTVSVYTGPTRNGTESAVADAPEPPVKQGKHAKHARSKTAKPAAAKADAGKKKRADAVTAEPPAASTPKPGQIAPAQAAEPASASSGFASIGGIPWTSFTATKPVTPPSAFVNGPAAAGKAAPRKPKAKPAAPSTPQ